MRIFNVWVDGIRRVNAAPAIIAGIWFMTALYVLPFALTLTLQRATALTIESGSLQLFPSWLHQLSLETTSAIANIAQEIAAASAQPLAFLLNESRVMAGIAAAPVYLLGWLFLSGGIIDRYARNRATRSHGFFAACGVFFFRFLRLGIVMAVAYGVIAYFLQSRPILMWPLLAGCNLLFDYTRVRAVVEDRRSMLGSVGAAASFLRRNWWSAVVIYALDAVLFAAVVAIFVVLNRSYLFLRVASTPIIWHEQLYVIGRAWVWLVFWATETALFQSRLAHAGYVGRPVPAWPESPSAEAIRNLNAS